MKRFIEIITHSYMDMHDETEVRMMNVMNIKSFITNLEEHWSGGYLVSIKAMSKNEARKYVDSNIAKEKNHWQYDSQEVIDNMENLYSEAYLEEDSTIKEWSLVPIRELIHDEDKIREYYKTLKDLPNADCDEALYTLGDILQEIGLAKAEIAAELKDTIGPDDFMDEEFVELEDAYWESYTKEAFDLLTLSDEELDDYIEAMCAMHYEW